MKEVDNAIAIVKEAKAETEKALEVGIKYSPINGRWTYSFILSRLKVLFLQKVPSRLFCQCSWAASHIDMTVLFESVKKIEILRYFNGSLNYDV